MHYRDTSRIPIGHSAWAHENLKRRVYRARSLIYYSVNSDLIPSDVPIF